MSTDLDEFITFDDGGELSTIVEDDGIDEVVEVETGTPGDPGKSAYQLAVADGFVGTELEWLESLRGAPGAPGAPGTPGAQGNPGPPGVSGGIYVHNQELASASWLIVHGLGIYPAVVVTDSSGQQVYGDVRYLDLNTVQLDFSSAFSGRADLV